jgi:hypothetical protein
MIESTGDARALALIRERMQADFDLFDDILGARDIVDVPRLKLRMAAIVCGMRSPFLDNSLERINLVRHLKEIRRRARALSYTVVPDIFSGQTAILLDVRLSILLGLLVAECISSELSFDLHLDAAGSPGLRIEAGPGSAAALDAFIGTDPFSSSLLNALMEAGAQCDRTDGLIISWKRNSADPFG